MYEKNLLQNLTNLPKHFSKNRLHIIFFSAALITIVPATLVIIGWSMHNDFPKEIIPGQLRIKFNAAEVSINKNINK